MKLFATTSRRTYRAKRKRTGWSTTLKAKTRLKRWAKRRTKTLWRTAKQRIRRRWNHRPSAVHNRQIARTAQQFQQHNTNMHTAGGYQVDASGAVSYQPGPAAEGGGQAKLPPPDGALSTCRRCSYDVVYNGGRQRWEHPGHGNYECFQPGGHT